MNTMIRWLIYFQFVFTAAIGQHVIEGKVVDKETGKPIPFASIGIEGMPRGTSSNINGEFSLQAPDTFLIKVTCLGYESALITSAEDLLLIQLKPVATQLDEIVIHYQEVNPKKIVRKAFSHIRDNYNDRSFLQNFFYRQYNQRDSVYESLVEASVDVWRNNGYDKLRKIAGENEALRINQLRRSLDITGMVQAKSPISFGYVLEADIAAYQATESNDHLNIFDEVSDLRINFNRYHFEFDGFSIYDGQEVYKINYESRKDSILTTSGYINAPSAKGTLYISTDTFAFIKTEETREDGKNVVRTSAYYLKHQEKYYPYHLIRESENHFKGNYFSHIELMAVEIRHGADQRFVGNSFDRDELLKIPYDSSFWNTATILKTTPLENKIIYDLGGGKSLNRQFYLYKQYEQNVTNGGVDGVDKLKWLIDNSKGKRNLYICLWNRNFKSYIAELEYFKRLYPDYSNRITFVMIALENDENVWKQLVNNYNWFSDGIVNYRVDESTDILKRLHVKNIPSFVLISKAGEINSQTKLPSDPLLRKDLNELVK